MKPVLNHIIVKCSLSELFNNKLVFKNGTAIEFPSKYDLESNVKTTFIVHEVPKRLSYSLRLYAEHILGSIQNKPMPHITDMELMVGDTVMVTFSSVMEAIGRLAGKDIKNNKANYIIDGEDIYILIHYTDVITAIRDGKLFPVNGYTIAKLMKVRNKRYDQSTLILPKEIRKTEPHRYAKVVAFGNKNRGYATTADGTMKTINSDFYYKGERDQLYEGAIILIKDNMFIPLDRNIQGEYKDLVYLSRRHMYAIITGLDKDFFDE